MRVGRAKLMGWTIRPTERDRNVELAAAHRQHIGSVVHHLIKGDEQKTEGHEFDDWTQSNHGGTDTEPGKSIFRNWRVDDSLWAEAFEQALRHFVGAIVFRHFLAHEKNIRIPCQF